MWRLAIKQVVAHRFRFVLTTLAVVIGVTFVSGTLVLTDTSQQLFDEKFSSRSSGSDVTVRTEVAFDEAMGVEVEHAPVPESLLDTVRDTAGVDEAVGVATGKGVLLVDGDAVESTGMPLVLSWTDEPFGRFEISAGHEPRAAGEVVLEQDTARRAGVEVGDTVTVQSDRVRELEVVGLAESTRQAAYEGASVALVDIDAAQELLRLGDGYSEIRVTADDGTTATALEDRLRDAVGKGYSVASSKDVARASSDAARTQLGYLQGALLALAAAALLIGGYLIANTFTIVVAQRTRELALLRAAGATARQVKRLLRGEALVVGVVGSAVGTVLGIGAAAALRGALEAAGADLPSGPAVIRPGSMLLAFAIGVTVTALAAVAPSRRAGRVSPLQAMRSAAAGRVAGRRRRVVGTVAGVASVAALVVVGAGGASVALAAVAGVLAVVALAALGPVLAGPLTRIVGRPLAALGVPGRLAGEFAAKAPRRTAATVLALSLSIGLIAFTTVLSASLRSEISDRYQEVVHADLVVESSGMEMLGGLSPAVYDRVAALPEVESATRMRLGHFKTDGTGTALAAVDPATVESAVTVEMRSGSLADLDRGGVMVSESTAKADGLEPGDTIAMTFPRGTRRVPVVGVYDDDLVAVTQVNYVIGLRAYERLYAEDVDADVFVTLAPGTDAEAAQAAVERALADFPNADVRDQAGATEGRTALLDQILGLVTAALLLTVLIALLGVTNTLALSIVERTQEIGLLRSIGMTDRQLRWMIRSEAAIQAAVAVVLGSVLGLGFAAATVRALGGTHPVPVVVPWGGLVTVLVLGTIAGLVAGMLPARRAARLRLMDAITTA